MAGACERERGRVFPKKRERGGEEENTQWRKKGGEEHVSSVGARAAHVEREGGCVRGSRAIQTTIAVREENVLVCDKDRHSNSKMLSEDMESCIHMYKEQKYLMMVIMLTTNKK
uniref:Uncharacterized protein n=2 Tax=Oryza TaxID=4527 RepID=Q6K423_ORYSJ|nr:hypothetical protein [Oryza sativa Japonica Group]